MAKVIENLKGINAYPIPLRTLVETADKRGLNLDTEATEEVLKGKTTTSPKQTCFCGCLSLLTCLRAGRTTLSRTNRERNSAIMLKPCTKTLTMTAAAQTNPFTDIKALGYDYSKRNNRIQDKDSERD